MRFGVRGSASDPRQALISLILSPAMLILPGESQIKEVEMN